MERKPIYTVTLHDADYTLFRTVTSDATPRWDWAVKDSLGFRWLDATFTGHLWSLYAEAQRGQD